MQFGIFYYQVMEAVLLLIFLIMVTHLMLRSQSGTKC